MRVADWAAHAASAFACSEYSEYPSDRWSLVVVHIQMCGFRTARSTSRAKFQTCGVATQRGARVLIGWRIEPSCHPRFRCCRRAYGP